MNVLKLLLWFENRPVTQKALMVGQNGWIPSKHNPACWMVMMHSDLSSPCIRVSYNVLSALSIGEAVVYDDGTVMMVLRSREVPRPLGLLPLHFLFSKLKKLLTQFVLSSMSHRLLTSVALSRTFSQTSGRCFLEKS